MKAGVGVEELFYGGGLLVGGLDVAQEPVALEAVHVRADCLRGEPGETLLGPEALGRRDAVGAQEATDAVLGADPFGGEGMAELDRAAPFADFGGGDAGAGTSAKHWHCRGYRR